MTAFKRNIMLSLEGTEDGETEQAGEESGRGRGAKRMGGVGLQAGRRVGWCGYIWLDPFVVVFTSEIVWNCSSRSLGIFYEMLSATHRDFDVISVFDDLLTR